MNDFARDLRPVGTIMGTLTRAPRTDDRLLALREIWAEAVGPEVARNAFPVRLTRSDVVVVHCSGSAWASELTLLRAHLHARLEESMGPAAPAELRFEVGELPLPDPVRAEGVRQPAINPRAAELAAEGFGPRSARDDRTRDLGTFCRWFVTVARRLQGVALVKCKAVRKPLFPQVLID